MADHRRPLGDRARQTGALLATANIPVTLQPTLMPRSVIDQALVTGWSFSAHHAATSFLQELLQSAALLGLGQAGRQRPDALRWHRATLVADAVAWVGGSALQRMVPSQPDERTSRAAVRTTGSLLATTGFGGLSIGVLEEVLGRRSASGRSPLPVVLPAAAVLTTLAGVRQRKNAPRSNDQAPASDQPLARTVALSLGVSIGSSFVTSAESRLADRLSRAASAHLPGGPAVWRPIGHLLSFGVLAAATKAAIEGSFRLVEAKETAVEPAFDLPPLLATASGSIESLVPFDSLAKQGRRFVWGTTPAATVAEVLGEDEAAQPIRIYVGLESAPTEEQRVALAVDELERTGAFDRGWLLVASPTGTGQMNATAFSAFEVLTRGDCATVALQYAARPSVISLDRVDEGRAQMRLLLEAIHARLAARPDRPRTVLFGESLGAWTSQDAVLDQGTDGLDALGIDHAVWIGTPHFSKWKDQVVKGGRDDVDPQAVAAFDSIEDWRRMPADRRERCRYVMITHDNDGVALFGPELLVQAPAWLGSARLPSTRVPSSMRWTPLTTFFQVLVDMKNATHVVPGVLEASGHDYRADLAVFFREVLDLPITEDQLERIEAWLAADELGRANWVDRHRATGAGMAAAVVRDWMEANPDRVEEALGHRLRTIALRGDAEPTPS